MKTLLRYLLISIVVMVPNWFYGQSLPADANLEVLKNKEIYEIFLDGPRQMEAANLIAKNAIIYWKYSRYDSALVLYNMASEIFYNHESYEELKTIYTNMGSIYLEKKDFTSSLKYYHRSLDLSKQLGSNEEVAAKMIDLSNAYLMNNQPEKALELVDNAMNLAKNEGNHNVVLNCFNQISEIYNQTGERWKSREYYLRYNHYRDSVEGYKYDLNKILAEERKKYMADEKHLAETKIQEVGKVKVEEPTLAKQTKTVATDDYMASRRKEAIQSIDTSSGIEIASSTDTDKEEIYRDVDVKPEFPGGSFGLQLFLANSVNFTQDYISGEDESIVIEHVVNKFGLVSDPRIIKGIHPVVDAEAMNALSQMPPWNPGKINNKNVSSYTRTVVKYPYPDMQTLIGDELLKLESRKSEVLKRNNKDTIPAFFIELGNLHFYLKENEKALEYYYNALKMLKENNDQAGVSDVLFNIATIYHSWVRYNKAIEYFLESYNIKQQLNDLDGSGKVLYQIGQVYFEMTDTVKALEYFNKSMDIDNILGNKQDKAVALNNIGIVYFSQKKLDKALNYYNDALNIYEEMNNKFGSATTINNIGNVHFEKKDFSKALNSYKKSLSFKEELQYYEGIAVSLHNIGNVYYKTDEYDNAIIYYKQSIEICQKYLFNDIEAKNYMALAQLFAQQENCTKTLEYRKLYANLEFYSGREESSGQLSEHQTKYIYHDNLSNNLIKKINELQQVNILKDKRINRYLEEIREQKLIAKLEAERAGQRIALLNKEKLLQKQEIQKKRLQNIGLAVILVLVILVLGVIFYNLRRNKALNKLLTKQKKDILEKNTLLTDKNTEIESQNEEIQMQRDALAEQNKRIAFQHKEMVDSINYAERIQTALLPKIDDIKKRFEDIFVLFKPKDIVSGDFFWFSKSKDRTIIVESDCTGHGVPGAFMSILGIKMLHEIVNEQGVYKPADIMNELRNKIIDTLHQKGVVHEIHDGMDISICAIEHKSNKLEIASANQRVYIFKPGELIEHKGQKMPVGHFIRMEDFTSDVYNLKKGDTIYMFSDGYMDQFGGEDAKKMKYKDFKELLGKCSKMPITAQKQFLDDHFNKWKGAFDQIDDVIIIGIKI